jgi:16S rRNA U516 pseudouridylate synthase RsuA-like enzyme
VVSLHRDRIGGLDLPPDLVPGAIREATEPELAALIADPGD